MNQLICTVMFFLCGAVLASPHRMGRPAGGLLGSDSEPRSNSLRFGENDFNSLDPNFAHQLKDLIAAQGEEEDVESPSVREQATRENADSTNGTVLASNPLVIDPDNLPEGWSCMDKVMMVEEIEYTDEERCTHIVEESCHDTFQTRFKAEEIEECKERFLKSCTIEYNAVPKMEKVEVCHQPMVRNCSIQGEEVCSDEYETVCDTQYHENEVEDDIPQCETIVEEVCDAAGKCTKVPRQECSLMKMNSTRLTPETDCRQEIRQVCGPEACPLTRGPKICAQEVKTFVQEVPEEICHLNPQKVCSPVSKIVPRLELEVKCIDVPREVCSTVQVEAKKVQRPTVKKWCGPTAAAAPASADDDSGTF